MLPDSLSFSPLKRRLVEASFSGGHITSDAGVLLLREIDAHQGLTQQLCDQLIDQRQPGKIKHDQIDLLRQRIYSIACGYEDLNDHDTLKDDLSFQTALNQVTPLASRSTLGRFEQQADRQAVIEAHRLMWKRFIAAYRKPPKRIILDFDATDIPVHGQLEGRFFHGYYDHYCFLPLYVFCGRHPLVSYLRPSNIDGAKHSWAILSLLVKFIRQYWPETQIIMRADSGFCRTSAGAEVDLVLEFPGIAEIWVIEIKRALSAKPKKGFYHACEDIQPHRSYVVYAGDERYSISGGAEAIGLAEMSNILLKGIGA